jgi:hypothetical protein
MVASLLTDKIAIDGASNHVGVDPYQRMPFRASGSQAAEILL